MLGEFFGTLILILFGDGVVANVLLTKSKGHNAGWIVITTGWGIAVTCGIFTAKALGGPGMLNPVGPITELAIGKMSGGAALNLVAAEFAGAFCGAILVWLHYLPHWRETSDPAVKLGVFCTGPAIRSPLANVLSEAIATFALVFVASSIAVATIGAGEPALVGMVVWGVGLSLGGTTGYAINPARDFAPRLAHFLLPIPGKGSSDWGYAWVPVVGPCLGALVAVKVFQWAAG